MIYIYILIKDKSFELCRKNFAEENFINLIKSTGLLHPASFVWSIYLKFICFLHYLPECSNGGFSRRHSIIMTELVNVNINRCNFSKHYRTKNISFILRIWWYLSFFDSCVECVWQCVVASIWYYNCHPEFKKNQKSAWNRYLLFIMLS